MDGEYEVEVSISIPQDSDGFIRRECDNCASQFKWHDGPANEEAEHQPAPVMYNCPLCGRSGDSWNTPEQAELARQAAMPQLMGLVRDDLEKMFRGRKGITFKRGNDEFADESEPLIEPDDMIIVVSPCHAFEPVKIPEEHTGPVYCLICGSAFTV